MDCPYTITLPPFFYDLYFFGNLTFPNFICIFVHKVLNICVKLSEDKLFYSLFSEASFGPFDQNPSLRQRIGCASAKLFCRL
jgi:hypothetical protein